MCLTSITTRPEPSDLIQIGWKVFGVIPVAAMSVWCFEVRYYKNYAGVPRGKWIQAEQPDKQIGNDDVLYRPGFHCFITKKDADSYSHSGNHVVKVLVKRVHTIGKQDDSLGEIRAALVADWMYVPAEGERIVGLHIVKNKPTRKRAKPCA